jgi:hypothetical protein
MTLIPLKNDTKLDITFTIWFHEFLLGVGDLKIPHTEAHSEFKNKILVRTLPPNRC